MGPTARALTLLACLLAAGASSGCLAEDFFPEPFQWRPAHAAGDSFQGADYRGGTAFAPPARTDRLRLRLNVSLSDATARGAGPLGGVLGGDVTPGLNVTIHLADGRSLTHRFTESGASRELVAAAPPGEVEVRVQGRGEGAWEVTADAFAPKYPDYAWWQAWRWGEGAPVAE